MISDMSDAAQYSPEGHSWEGPEVRYTRRCTKCGKTEAQLIGPQGAPCLGVEPEPRAKLRALWDTWMVAEAEYLRLANSNVQFDRFELEMRYRAMRSAEDAFAAAYKELIG